MTFLSGAELESTLLVALKIWQIHVGVQKTAWRMSGAFFHVAGTL